MIQKGMRPWKRWICRCGWMSESFRCRTDRIDGQCQVHRAQCRDCRHHGMCEEETEAGLRAERDALREDYAEALAEIGAIDQAIDRLIEVVDWSASSDLLRTLGLGVLLDDVTAKVRDALTLSAEVGDE